MNKEMLVIGLEEAVMEKGTKGMIKQFNDKREKSKKKKGNIDSRYIKILKESYECDWRSVEVSGIGANRVLTCIGRKEISDIRVDGRVNNGNRDQLPYRKDIREAIIKYLHKHKNDNRATITTKRLAYELGCFSEIMYEASRKIGTDERENYFNKCAEKDKRMKALGQDMFYECVNEVGRLTKQVESVLDELRQNDIIYYADVIQAVTGEDDLQQTYKLLDPNKVIDIKQKQMQLRKKHGVTHQDIMFKLKSNAVKAYKRDERAYFNYMGFDRVFETKIISLSAYDKEIENYFSRKPLTNEFRFKHIDVAVNLAGNREDAFHNKPIVTRNNYQLQKELAGKLKRDVYIETSTAKDMIVGDYGIAILENNEVIQLKMSKAYKDNVESGLKTLQVDAEITA